MPTPSFETMSRGQILDWLYGPGRTSCHQVCTDEHGYALQLVSAYGMVSIGDTTLRAVLLRAAYAVEHRRVTSLPRLVEVSGNGSGVS